MAKFNVSSVSCPVCGAEEVHKNGKTLQIRAFKVGDKNGYWWSQCLVCAGHYDKVNGVSTPDNFDRLKGWF